MRMTFSSSLRAQDPHRLVENKECSETSEDGSTILSVYVCGNLRDLPNDDIPLLLDYHGTSMMPVWSFSKERVGDEVEENIT